MEHVKSGGYLHLNNLQTKESKRFSSYRFTDDKHRRIFFSKIQPDTFVKYGKYEMREMDRRLIEAGCVTRATVKWWGGVQFAHPYLWKANSTEIEYQEAWNDSRVSEPQQVVSPISNTSQSVNPIFEAAKSVTDTLADIASTLGGLFDISLSSVSDDTAEEAEFRRLMQKKEEKEGDCSAL